MTISDLIDNYNSYILSLIPLYYEWSFAEPGSEEEEFLSQTIAHFSNACFGHDIDKKKTFLLSLER